MRRPKRVLHRPNSGPIRWPPACRCFPEVERIRVVLDNLFTHTAAALYAAPYSGGLATRRSPFGGLIVDDRASAWDRTRFSALELRPLIAAVGIELQQKREHPEQGGQQHGAAVAILDVGGRHDGVQHETLGVDQDMPLLALDLLAGVVTVRIDRGPAFFALFTLWASMIAAVGLGENGNGFNEFKRGSLTNSKNSNLFSDRH